MQLVPALLPAFAASLRIVANRTGGQGGASDASHGHSCLTVKNSGGDLRGILLASMKNTFLLIGLQFAIAIAPASFAQSAALQFKGLEIGAAVSEFQAKFPDIRCTNTRETAEKAHEKIRAVMLVTTDYSDISCFLLIGDQKLPATLSDVAGHRAKSLSFLFFGNELRRAYATLPIIAFRDIVAALTERYGEPSDKSRSVMQTRAGASYENEILSWTRGNARVQVEKYHDDINTSIYSIQSDDYQTEVQRRRMNRAKGAAKNL